MKTIKRFFDFLYSDIPASFTSDFPLTVSVERLRERTNRTVFSALLRQAAVGPVTESRVRLQRVIPLFGNSFKPIFVGRFERIEGRGWHSPDIAFLTSVIQNALTQGHLTSRSSGPA